MNNSKIKKKIKSYSIVLLILGTLIFNVNLITWNIAKNNFPTKQESINDDDSNDFQIKNLQTSDYQSSFNGSGEDISIKLHQSYLNNTFDTMLNTSDSNNNTFKIPCPTDISFNSSYIRFDIENIYAPNKTLIVEDDTITSFDDFTNSNPLVTSFNTTGDGYLENVSVYVRNVNANQATVTVVLYNSTWDTGNNRNEPDGNNLGYIATLGTFNVPATTTGTYSVNNIHYLLNVDNTENNTWFIGLFDGGVGADTRWYYVSDQSNGDNDNESIAYYYSSGWILRDDILYGDKSVDFRLLVGLMPLNNTPSPEQIGLKIDNDPASGYGDGIDSGYWESTEVYSSASGELQYTISADWWDITCIISQVQINYTKTNLKATSTFNAPESQSFDWNVTRIGGLNFFNSTFSDYRINFTIPASWENFTAYNGGIDKTSDISLGPIQNQYRDLQISNAGNGTYWYINAQSYNLLQAIDMYKGIDKITEANYSDTVSFIARFTENIDPGIAEVNLSIYNPVSIDDKLNFTTVNDTSTQKSDIYFEDWIVSNWVFQYGIFRVQVFWSNGTAAGFLEETITIYGETELLLISPESGQEYFVDQVFNMTIYYNDIGQTLPILDAIVNNNSTLTFYPNGTAGYYTAELNTSDFAYGWNYIEITASKTYYNEAKTQFSFHLRMYTTISPSNFKDFGDIIKGSIVEYEFNYSDDVGVGITGADRDIVSIDLDFILSYTENIGEDGNYTIQLDTSNVQARSEIYSCIFNITAVGKQTQVITLNLTIISTQTKIDILSYDLEVVQNTGLDQSVRLNFSDTDNNLGIDGLTDGYVTVRENQTGGEITDITLTELDPVGSPGEYELNISVSDLESGVFVQLEINITYDPNYNTSLGYVEFYLKGNLTKINMISVSDPGGDEELTLKNYAYSCFIDRDLFVNFTILDTDNGDKLITDLDHTANFSVVYHEISNPTNQGTLIDGLSFDFGENSFQGDLITSAISTAGSYMINITVIETNFEDTFFSFNLTIKARFIANLTVIYQPTSVKAGDAFTVVLKARYNNGTEWLLIVGEDITITPYFNGNPGAAVSDATNSSGEAELEITVIGAAKNMNLSVVIGQAYYHESYTFIISDIDIIPLERGFTLEDLMPYLIIIGAVTVAGIAAVSIYRGVVVPKKREKKRVLSEVRTIFDDAINLEHILVLYKATGTCIFFKSFGSEKIDPELISGFISAVSSFGKEMVAQKALNEITYGDKMLLLADGEYTRVALVLSKNASLILRKHITAFIGVFEKNYEKELPNWRGQLNFFRNAGLTVDDVFNTSIILPHKITYDFSDVKSLKNPHSKDVLKIAHSCCEESERDFFFIATLLKEASENTKKDTAEIFSGIKELRDKKILLPIEISAIEARPVSQQEINLISQKVANLVALSTEEKQKLVNDLAQLGPAEREAYFASITTQQEIVSQPVDLKTGAIKVENLKAAKKEIKNLVKNADKSKKEKNYENAGTLYQNAAMIASNWELTKLFDRIQDIIRVTRIEDSKIKLKQLEKEAKEAVKKKKYSEATEKYRIASKLASEIFKLGVTEMTKEVKRLSNKSKEYEKLI